jgi:mono/diheme cytochrome c family protein
MENPEFLEIAVASREDTSVLPDEFAEIQARIGLEKLMMVSNEAVAGGRKLVFDISPRASKQTGLQVVFLGFVAPRELSTANSKFRLLAVRWRKNSEQLNMTALLDAAAPEGSLDPYSENRARLLAQTAHADLPSEPTPVAAVALPDGVLVFDSEKKETIVHEGDSDAHFVFNFTNVSSKNVIISAVTTSCGCTTAELPHMPWILVPHAKGRIPVTMNVVGHTGKDPKTVTVTTDQGFKTLNVEANILPLSASGQMGDRERNLELAKVDRQAVFKGDCAKCHADPAKGKTGQELYMAACAICHEAKPRASMVPDLQILNHPTDSNYWKMIIALGKPGTLMPAFADEMGGPLNGDQIVSLAEFLTQKFPTGQAATPPVKPDTQAH